MEKEVVFTDRAPKPVGAYSQAVAFGGVLYISGQIAIDPKSGEFVSCNAVCQTELIMKNIGEILKTRGLSYSNLLKIKIYTTDITLFNEINSVYTKYFDKDPPARVFVEVSALPKNALIEIEGEAALK